MNPVVTFRAWRANEAHQLTSVYKLMPWKVGVNEARCIPRLSQKAPHAEDAPQSDCRCGLYGTTRLNLLWDIYQRFPYQLNRVTLIAGAVLMWGETIVGDKGVVRAQYAQILALTDSPHRPIGANRIDESIRKFQLTGFAMRYQVPFYPPEAVELYASEFGDLLPEKPSPGDS